MSEEAQRFGDFQKSSILQGLQEYINMSRMGKDHYDRDTMVHEFYYAILLCTEVCSSAFYSALISVTCLHEFSNVRDV